MYSAFVQCTTTVTRHRHLPVHTHARTHTQTRAHTQQHKLNICAYVCLAVKGPGSAGCVFVCVCTRFGFDGVRSPCCCYCCCEWCVCVRVCVLYRAQSSVEILKCTCVPRSWALLLCVCTAPMRVRLADFAPAIRHYASHRSVHSMCVDLRAGACVVLGCYSTQPTKLIIAYIYKHTHAHTLGDESRCASTRRRTPGQ